MLTKKRSEPDDTRVSDLYVAEPLYILERDLNILKTEEKKKFRKELSKLVTETLCLGKITFEFEYNDTGIRLFFKEKPLHKNAVFKDGNLVGVLQFDDVEETYIYAFCSNQYGRFILNKYVFPLIAIDDYTTFIKLDAVKSAIGFYWIMGFDFFDTKNNIIDHDRGTRFEKLIKQYRNKLMPYLKEFHTLSLENDLEGIKNEIPKNIYEEFQEEFPKMIWKRKPEEVIRIIPKD